MALEGLHHVTAITGDAPRNVDFYARLLGLRLVKKTVNFDQPDVYHLYFGDERGAPGSILTFFEFPGAALGHAGDGMVHTVQWRVGSEDALAFWAARLANEGVATEGGEGTVAFADFEGLRHELVAVTVQDAPLVAHAPDVPAEHALQGFHGVRAYAQDSRHSAHLLKAMDFEPTPGGFSHRAGDAVYVYDNPPDDPGIQGAGSVHHVAWAAKDEDHPSWRSLVQMAGARPTEIIDRTYFRSIYFREPSGVLFEIATLSPGFAVDEPAGSLGESLVLPERYESRRERIERILTPVTNPRTRTAA